jgi:serine/threonine-protein kinase RIO1
LAFDPKTRLILYKALNNCLLNEIGSIIATGKESVVLYGKGGQTEERQMPEEVAVKVRHGSVNTMHLTISS